MEWLVGADEESFHGLVARLTKCLASDLRVSRTPETETGENVQMAVLNAIVTVAELRSPTDFENEHRLFKYTLEIARHNYYGRFRRARKELLERVEDIEGIAELIDETSDNEGLLHIAIKRLPIEWKFVIESLFFEGHRQKDVAAMLGKSEATVSRIKQRAFKKLRRIIQETLDDEE